MQSGPKLDPSFQASFDPLADPLVFRLRFAVFEERRIQVGPKKAPYVPFRAGQFVTLHFALPNPEQECSGLDLEMFSSLIARKPFDHAYWFLF